MAFSQRSQRWTSWALDRGSIVVLQNYTEDLKFVCKSNISFKKYKNIKINIERCVHHYIYISPQTLTSVIRQVFFLKENVDKQR